MTFRRSGGNVPVRRHLTSMILAFAFASMAVLREAVPFGLPFPVTVVLPLVVAIPLILHDGRRLRERGRSDAAGGPSLVPEA